MEQKIWLNVQITGKKMYIYEKGQVFVFLFKKY
jgi:hypothetical protein